jgi:hypothetical protein
MVYLQHEVVVAVQDCGLAVFRPANFVELIQVNVTMNEVAGFEPTHERKEGLESPVRLVRAVMNTSGRCMSEKNI